MIEKQLAELIESLIEDEYQLKGTFESNEVSLKIASMAIEHFRMIHSRALACHCECLGMNAENSIAACNGNVPPYRDADYFHTTQKWGLTNEKGEPLI